jgi:hypothetical protein
MVSYFKSKESAMDTRERCSKSGPGASTEPCINISQKKLKPKIYAYLVQQNRDLSLAQKFSEKSDEFFCHGLSVLVGYGQYLEHSLKILANCKTEQDNWTWLNNTLQLIASWDENLTSLSEKNKFDIDRLIALVNFIQNISSYLPLGQGNLHHYLEDNAQRKLKLEYTFAGLFTANNFTEALVLKNQKKSITLLDTLTQYQQRIILMSCGKHSAVLFRVKDHISLYHANHATGPVWHACSQAQELANALFRVYKYKTDQASPFGFRIFTFDEKTQAYPQQNILLDCFNNPLRLEGKRKKIDYSALHIASRIESIECATYYLEKGAALDNTEKKNITPLYIAASRHYLPLVHLYISKGADINKICKEKETPLIRASKRGHISVIKAMLEYPKNSQLSNLITALSCLPSQELGGELIKTINTDALRKMMSNLKLVKTTLLDYSNSVHYKKSVYEQLVCLRDKYTLKSTSPDLLFFKKAQAENTSATLTTESSATMSVKK